jgi:hypothetical protein
MSAPEERHLPTCGRDQDRSGFNPVIRFGFFDPNLAKTIQTRRKWTGKSRRHVLDNEQAA